MQIQNIWKDLCIKNLKYNFYFGTDFSFGDSPVFKMGQTLEGIKDGKIIKAEAGEKTKELNEILDTDEGARYIGEFALGLNPYIKNVMGDTLFDEKICGSFHFTPGDALEESDNGNRSSIHWDIVCIQTPEFGGGEIYFDDVLVRKDGRFKLPELMQLNPEMLKNND